MESGFKKYISDKISDGQKDLGNELYKEIQNNCESMFAIWKKSRWEWLVSLFSNQKYLHNIIEIICDNFSERIEYVIKLIETESNNYLDEAKESIDLNVTNLTLSFTNQQKDKWGELGLSYQTIKKKIYDILKK